MNQKKAQYKQKHKVRSSTPRQESKEEFSFLDTGYYRDQNKEILREDLIVEHADRLGKEFVEKRSKLTSAQLRKFFNDVHALKAKVEYIGFDNQRPMIKMLKSKVAYAKGRDKIPAEFKDFIDACVDKIEDKKDFEGFIKFFESVVGFYYFYGGK